MPKLIHEAALQHFVSYPADTTQVVTLGRFEGSVWYCKKPPAELTDPKTQSLRILNEAICGATQELINQHLGERFLTPSYRLVCDEEGSLKAVLVQSVAYEYMGDLFYNKQGLLALLSKPGLAEIDTTRSFFQDPDACYNIGDKGDKLSSIDYGLANYPLLKQQNALTQKERNCLSAKQSKQLFTLTEASIFSGILQPRDEGGRGFLAHHAIENFNSKAAQLCEAKEEVQPLKEFIVRVARTYSVIMTLLTADNYRDKIWEQLGLNELAENDQDVCEKLIQGLVSQALSLKEALIRLRRCTPTQFELLARENKIDERLVPILLETSPYCQHSKNIRFSSLIINSLVEESAAEHDRRRSSVSGRITPANGGGPDGYSSVLRPTSLSPHSVSMWLQESKKVTEEAEFEMPENILSC